MHSVVEPNPTALYTAKRGFLYYTNCYSINTGVRLSTLSVCLSIYLSVWFWERLLYWLKTQAKIQTVPVKNIFFEADWA